MFKTQSLNKFELNKIFLFLRHYSNTTTSSSNSSPAAPNSTTNLDRIQQTVNKTIQLASTLISNLNEEKDSILNKIKSSTNTSPSTSLSNNEKELRKLAPSTIETFILPKKAIEDQARFYCKSIKRSSSILIKTLYIEALSKHLYDYSNDIRHIIIYEENLIKHLLELKLETSDKRLIGYINECLALCGIVDVPKRAGINILCLDGGGSRGFVAIEILKNIEKQSNGKKIHELFDYICGCSTGAVLAMLLGIYKLPLDEIRKHYKVFVKEIFERNSAVGLGNLLMGQSYYDTNRWETKLRELTGEKLIINSVRDCDVPKVSAISCVTTPNHMKIFLFRNYNLPITSEQQSHYEGTYKHCVWQAIRASSAAPGYYQEFKFGGHIFHDGGLLANNPSAIAIHECKQLWPNHDIQTVVSIGNGRYQPAEYATSKCESLSVKQKVNRIVGGATSTENVHTILHDLLPPKVYFRFNPYMSEEFQLDESRPEKWQVMEYDAQMYNRRNEYKFQMALEQLNKAKKPFQIVNEYVKKRLAIY